tara:strand:+ start:123 stop:413 length:291 start_codon:yes stop_codon:yes gene_type:complete
MEWERLDETFVQFEEVGQTVEGVLTYKGVQEMPGGTVGRYSIQEDDRKVAILGSTQIDRVLAQVELQSRIRIVYTGEFKTARGQKMKSFEISRFRG